MGGDRAQSIAQAEVLFLDEATNSFDVQTEPQVWKYLLAHITAQTTLFIVTHRAESPIVVDHEEVITRKGFTRA